MQKIKINSTRSRHTCPRHKGLILPKQEYRELDDNIRKMMAVKNENAASDLAIMDSDARRIAAKFEVKHPHVGGLIRQLADILQSMGV